MAILTILDECVFNSDADRSFSLSNTLCHINKKLSHEIFMPIFDHELRQEVLKVAMFLGKSFTNLLFGREADKNLLAVLVVRIQMHFF